MLPPLKSVGRRCRTANIFKAEQQLRPTGLVVYVLATVLFCLIFSFSSFAQDYARVDAIFSKYCLDCHSSKDPDGKLVLEDFGSLMKGGENGSEVVAGDSAASRLTRMVEGTLIKEGKLLIMPPGRKRKKLEPPEIAAIKSWIDAARTNLRLAPLRLGN